MYTVKKIINNNVILVDNSKNNESIIIGKGIGFNAKIGMVYIPTSHDDFFINPKDNGIYNILENIPLEIVKVTIDVINLCKPILNAELNESLLITLSEHIYFAIERSKDENMSISLHEVPYLYYLEFMAGKKSVTYINEKLNVNLPQSEASLIALHFVNAKLNSNNVGDTLKLTKIVYDIVNIINYSFHIYIDNKSEDLARFINHLKYLLIRCQVNDNKSSRLSPILKGLIEKELVKNFTCAKKIAKLIESQYNIKVNNDEIIYISLHIERLINSVS